MSAPTERRVLAVLEEYGALSGNAIARILGRRRADVSAALRALDAAGHITRTRDGHWQARGTPAGRPLSSVDAEPVGPVGSRASGPENRLTASAPDRMSRTQRVTTICAALSPAGRDRAWAALDSDKRADLLAILFDAEELNAEPPPITFASVTPASAYDAWQRSADR